MLGKSHLTLLAQLYEKRLALLILEDCVQFFDDSFLGGKQPMVCSCAHGAYLTLSTSTAKVKKRKYDVGSLETLSYLLKMLSV